MVKGLLAHLQCRLDLLVKYSANISAWQAPDVEQGPAPQPALPRQERARASAETCGGVGRYRNRIVIDIDQRQQTPGGGVAREAVNRLLKARAYRWNGLLIDFDPVCVEGKRARVGGPIVGRIDDMERLASAWKMTPYVWARLVATFLRDIGLGLREARRLSSSIIAVRPQNRAVGAVYEPDPKPEGIGRQVDASGQNKA